MVKNALLVVACAALLCTPAFTQSSDSGNIGTALTKLDALVNDTMQKTKLPGLAVAVVYKGQVVFIKGDQGRSKGDR